VATHLRTYVNPRVEQSFADYKIWEAARATSAAPTYFRGIKLGGVEYVDGGLGFNNVRYTLPHVSFMYLLTRLTL
jgi:patatin-like phospholipase/acyl hydrolase